LVVRIIDVIVAVFQIY